MKAEKFVEELDKFGVGPYIGVPCSFLKPLIAYLDTYRDKYDYYSASNEGESMGIAAGFSLSGKIPVVLMQNSGLGNAINPLTSLTMIFKLKTLLIISLRGEVGIMDEPQHEIMGKKTIEILDLLNIKHEILDEKNACEQIKKIISIVEETEVAGALIIRKNFFDDINIEKNNRLFGISRANAIKMVCDVFEKKDCIISTTGKISRELYYYGREERGNFYVIGSMGCAASIGFGIALQNLSRRVIVLDGDGAILMKLGTLTTIGKYKTDNFIHIILDNESYDSTGGQNTNSNIARIDRIALECGYDRTFYCTDVEEFQRILEEEKLKKGTVMILIKVDRGSPPVLGRPQEKPQFYKDRFMKYLEDEVNEDE